MTHQTSQAPLDSLPTVRPYAEAAGASTALSVFLTNEGSPELAVAFAHFFWPEFVEVEGCVLLKERFDPQNFRRWQEEYGGDCALIEKMVSHTHLDALFLGSDGVGEDAYDHLAHMTAKIWAAALREQFPDKTFEFLVSLEDEVAIYFWQAR